MTPLLALIIIAIAAIGVAIYKRPLKRVDMPVDYKNILSAHVAFYRNLDTAGKTRFEKKIKEFLGYIRITGVGTVVDDLDRLLIASSAVDGLPEALLQKQYSLPWLQLMAENIAAIKAGRSDMNSYGATNKAEFLAVAAEYFFGQPELFKTKHPELYDLLTRIFHQRPPERRADAGTPSNTSSRATN